MRTQLDNCMQRMLSDIESEVILTRHLTGRERFDRRVMEAMAQVPRNEFVPEEMAALAFNDGPLPIGYGQTISQPYIVALMTDLLAPQPDHSLLEIGTGSGYQTAILARLCDTVYSMERLPALSRSARTRLLHLGYKNIRLCSGNGYRGWPEHAPYNGIIVTAAAPSIPEDLVIQLKPGGRLVIPVGERYGSQQLLLLTKDPSGTLRQRNILGVAFVPLVDEQPDIDSGHPDSG